MKMGFGFNIIKVQVAAVEEYLSKRIISGYAMMKEANKDF